MQGAVSKWLMSEIMRIYISFRNKRPLMPRNIIFIYSASNATHFACTERSKGKNQKETSIHMIICRAVGGGNI